VRRHGGNDVCAELALRPLYQLVADEDGQDVVEYGLLIATIAIVVVLAANLFGTQIRAWFGTLAGRITTTGVS
jgi:Flp pilus assembly pilin Flp